VGLSYPSYRYWFQPFLGQLVLDAFIIAQITLATSEDNGNARAEVAHFRNPSVWYILKAVRIDNRETDEDNIRVRVRQRAQAIVVFLPYRWRGLS
jgi:hypothetical protein